ncbi:hypothetical protein KJ691_00810 [bacterium]|nr:hypothetical protein [bacterium]
MLYKNILFAFIIALFAGCSTAPAPKTLPDWFIAPPQHYEFFYAVGAGEDTQKAKNIAIYSLRKMLIAELNAKFQTPKHRLGFTDDETLSALLKSNEHLCKTLSMRNIKIEKAETFQGKSFVLVKLSKKAVFENIKTISEEKFLTLQKDYDKQKDEIAIQRFITLKPLAKQYAELASYAQLKELTITTYSAGDEFELLKNIKDSYAKLKSEISFYVLSDANSIPFVHSIKSSLQGEGLGISNKPKSKESLKILVTSITEDSIDYSFMQSKSLLKLTTYDRDKNEIAFRQHTFIGKSRKDYKEAKEQSALHTKSKIQKLGIFDFIGLKVAK